MIAALVIAGVVCLLVAAAFFWLNLNTPIQTSLPVVFGPLGLVALFLAALLS